MARRSSPPAPDGRKPARPTIEPPKRHTPERTGTARVVRSSRAGIRYEVAGAYAPDHDGARYDIDTGARLEPVSVRDPATGAMIDAWRPEPGTVRDGSNPYGRGAAYDPHGSSARARLERERYATVRRAAAIERRERAQATARAVSSDARRIELDRLDQARAALDSIRTGAPATAPVPTGATVYGARLVDRPRARRPRDEGVTK